MRVLGKGIAKIYLFFCTFVLLSPSYQKLAHAVLFHNGDI
jgi:hypothetical protein